MAKRSRAREVALQLLYESDRNPHARAELADAFLRERLHGEELRRFAAELVAGVRSKRPELDRMLEPVAQNWSLGRMSPIDRNILRLATYEIAFRADIPPKAALDEAIELAKRYGAADSPRFVNGILDRILSSHAPGGVPGPHQNPAEASSHSKSALVT